MTPLRSQLQQLQKTGAVLSEMTQPGLGRRGLEQNLTATKAAVDSLFDVVSSVKERVGDTSTIATAQVNSTRRLESLVQSVSVVSLLKVFYCDSCLCATRFWHVA